LLNFDHFNNMEHINYPLQEKIQSFVAGDMDEASRKSFLSETARDAEAKEELAFSKSLSRALQNREMVAASLIISQVVAEEGFPPPSAPPAPSSGRTWMGLGAAALVVLLGWFGYQWSSGTGFFSSEAKELAASTLRPLENVLFLPSQGAGLTDLQAGMAAYDAGKYEDAARLLSAYERSRPDQAVQVYLGVSLLFSDRSADAVRPLAEASMSPEPPVQEAACWYLALAYLAQDKPDAAQQALSRIPADGIFGAQAQTLLTQLPK
jgi:hypothetical protein